MLQVALAAILAVVVLERPLDVHRVRVVAFDEVGIVAVHRAHQVGKRSKQGRGQTAAEAGGLLGELQRKVGEWPRWREPSLISSGSIREASSPLSSAIMSAFNAIYLVHPSLCISVRYLSIKLRDVRKNGRMETSLQDVLWRSNREFKRQSGRISIL